jgi:apolipoprotein N-acyltransferase
VLTGVLTVLAFPRYGAAIGLDHLIWIALLPLFLAARGVGARQGFLLGGAAGTVLESGGFLWILHAIERFTSLPGPVAALAFLGWLLYASIPWALLGLALGRCARPVSILWVLPFWVGLEHYFPRLFPWHLGGALYAREWLVQVVDLFGTSGLTALVFLTSSTLYLLWEHLRGHLCFPGRTVLAAVLLLLGANAYGRLRLAEMQDLETQAPRLSLLVVQGALEPERRWKDGIAEYLALTREALRSGPVDLVVWPEGADNLAFDLTPGADPWWAHRKARSDPPLRLDRELPVPLVSGSAGYVKGREPEGSNIAVFVRPGEPLLFYEKNERLFLGEHVPGLELLPRSWREALGLRFIGTIAAGTTNPLMPLQGWGFRNLVCYEATLPGSYRAAARDADFLVNVTEDIWYGRTSHVEQHVSVLILRAVENRVPLVRAANMGPSGVIDITGRFRRSERAFTREVLRTHVRPRRAATLYSVAGHRFPLVAALAVLGRALWPLASRLRPPPAALRTPASKLR